ncbi:hypothetical protein, partial [Holdemania filiformis]|uniref:hypothetical protein n=1 Tax=Holdemania filiformis TaxID=61171 RepID=UPI00267508D3
STVCFLFIVVEFTFSIYVLLSLSKKRQVKTSWIKTKVLCPCGNSCTEIKNDLLISELEGSVSALRSFLSPFQTI